MPCSTPANQHTRQPDDGCGWFVLFFIAAATACFIVFYPNRSAPALCFSLCCASLSLIAATCFPSTLAATLSSRLTSINFSAALLNREIASALKLLHFQCVASVYA